MEAPFDLYSTRVKVVVINKIDIPEVRAKLDDLTKQVKKLAGHSRVIGISAATGERVKELMQRVRKVVDSLPSQSDFELFTEEEDRVSFEDETSDKFEIFTDERFPGQFRVAGDKIEKVLKAVMKYIISQCFVLVAVVFNVHDFVSPSLHRGRLSLGIILVTLIFFPVIYFRLCKP